MEQLRRARDKKKIHHHGHQKPLSVHEASAEAFAQLDIVPATPEDLEKVASDLHAIRPSNAA